MTRIVRQVSKKFFILANIAAVIAFLLVCCTGFLSPGKFWYVAMLGIAFPFIVLTLTGFVFFWLFAKSRWIFLSLAALLLGWPQVHKMFALHLFSSFSNEKPAGALRVMQWNVSRLDQMNLKRPGGNYRMSIFNFIQEMNPDILCMEEFLESNNTHEFPENIPYISKVLKFPYHFFARDHRRGDGVYEHGVIIFSKYPITDTLRIRYATPDSLKAAESLIHADINVNGQAVRVFATHLQSLRFSGNDYIALQTIKKAETSAIDKSKGILKKFKLAYSLRSSQADMVRNELDNSPHPIILCGDFNDVPNSYTYSKIKGDDRDAFLARGFGIGRTFSSLSPTLRIDYILTDKKTEVLQCKKTRLPFSDHYPLVADIVLPQDK